MRIFKVTIGLAMLAYCAAPALGQQAIQTAFNYNLSDSDSKDAPAAAPAKSSCGCEKSSDASCGCESSCGCENSCGCEGGCCSSGCGGGDWCGLCSGGCLGEPCTLHDELTPCCKTTYGGWIDMGYYSNNDRLSTQNNDLKSFGDDPDNLNLNQAWFWVERKAKSNGCCCDWGYRFDMLYGTDAQLTQAFGNENPTWDVTFDHGIYGWAMPQAYGELAYGDWTIMAGHFYTLIGYEVVQAPDSFFFSHSYQMFNSEPFTHTGVVAAYQVNDKVSLHAGWTLGWDTGFDQFGGGSNFLGGIDAHLNDNVEFIYMLTAGNFGFRSADTDGYSHSIVFDCKVSECMNYVLQSDFVSANGFNGDPNFDNQDVGIANYLIYKLSDRWSAGGRAEWWRSNQVTGEQTSFYEITGGVNYKPHANVTLRPEVKYNWTPAEQTVDPNFNEVLFAVDAVVTF